MQQERWCERWSAVATILVLTYSAVDVGCWPFGTEFEYKMLAKKLWVAFIIWFKKDFTLFIRICLKICKINSGTLDKEVFGHKQFKQ